MSQGKGSNRRNDPKGEAKKNFDKGYDGIKWPSTQPTKPHRFPIVNRILEEGLRGFAFEMKRTSKD